MATRSAGRTRESTATNFFMALFQSNTLWVQEFAEGVAVLQFDPRGKVVRLTDEALSDLEAALDQVSSERRFRLLVIRSLKKGNFCHGPDVAQWSAMKAPEEFQRWAKRGQGICDRIRGLSYPSVAWVEGSCFGAGLELALTCDQVVAVHTASTAFAFNELDIGLIPSWGSLGELIRRVGLESSFPLVLGGRRVSASEALRLGLIDSLETQESPDYNRLAATAVKRDRQIWRRAGLRKWLLERFAIGRRLLFRGIERVQLTRLPDDLPAPREMLAILKLYADGADDTGVNASREALVSLASTQAFLNLVRLHQLRDRARVQTSKLGLPQKARKVGIVGTTPLGLHLLLETVRRGGHVILREPDEGRLGMTILHLVRLLNNEVRDGASTPKQVQKYLSQIRSTVAWKNFDEADLVFDARSEGGDGLCPILQQVSSNCVVVATTPAQRIETVTEGQERVAGMFVPPPWGAGSVVELRRASRTSDAAFRILRDWVGMLGMLPITVADLPGLLLTRLWVPAWNEAVLLIREGMRIERVDQALSRFGLGRNLLESLDRMGLDQVAQLVNVVRDELSPRIPLDPFWNEVAERGWLGQSSGRGFYHHGRRPRPNHLLENWLHSEPPSHGERLPAMSHADQIQLIQDRVVMLMINEAFRCLGEGRVQTAEALDLALMLTDWAPHRGGPLRYAEQAGMDSVIGKLCELERFGPRYEPHQSISREAIK